MVNKLVLIHFGRSRLGETIKTNFKTYQNVDPEIRPMLFFYEGAWN